MPHKSNVSMTVPIEAPDVPGRWQVALNGHIYICDKFKLNDGVMLEMWTRDHRRLGVVLGPGDEWEALEID